jgi:hypothetical protein
MSESGDKVQDQKPNNFGEAVHLPALLRPPGNEISTLQIREWIECWCKGRSLRIPTECISRVSWTFSSLEGTSDYELKGDLTEWSFGRANSTYIAKDILAALTKV